VKPKILFALSASLALSACDTRQATTTDRGLVNTSLDALSKDNLPTPQPTPAYDASELARLTQEALNLQAALAAIQPEDSAPTPATEPIQAPLPETAAADPPPAEDVPALPPPLPSTKPLATRIDETTIALVDLLLQQAATESSTRAYLALAALEVLRPGALPNIITAATTEGSTISPEEQRAIEDLRSFLAAIAASSSTPLSRAFAEHAHLLTASAPLQVRAAQLCSEVISFGQFVTLPSSSFVQGRNIRAIVYAEVDHFTHRPIADGDRTLAGPDGRTMNDSWAVDLSQELRLYHNADGLLVWSRPEQGIIETSRNRRRDFYLVQPITLPSTLTIGSYTLKVSIRDRTSGHLAEANIPLDIVADPALTSR
jgi:hypothetical protein